MTAAELLSEYRLLRDAGTGKAMNWHLWGLVLLPVLGYVLGFWHGWLDKGHTPENVALNRAYRQACTNLAVRSFHGKDISLAEEAELWQEALLAGWSGIEGWPPGETT
jgi:hypothetical protein